MMNCNEANNSTHTQTYCNFFCEKFDNTKTFPGLERVAHNIFIIENM